MGFGSGYSSRTDRNIDARKADGSRARNNFTNDMLAHVWASQSQSGGQTANGNAYFVGRVLYSYGTHYATGVHFGDIAFLNADHNSVSTNGHRSDAAAAVRHLPRFNVAGLTEMADDLDRIADDRYRGDARAFLSRHALALGAARQIAPGGYAAADDAETAGEYLARKLKLAKSWPKIHREAVKAEAKRIADLAADKLKMAEGRALRLSDMSAPRWRDYIASIGTDYHNGFPQLANELHRARKLMLAAKSGKLASKTRLATIRARLAQAKAEAESFHARREGRVRRQSMRNAIGTVRSWRDAKHVDSGTISWANMCSLNAAAETLAARAPMPLRRSAATLADLARVGMIAIERETNRQRHAAAEERKRAQADRVANWLAGKAVGRVRFDAESGGAAMRIVGDVLETSHGAEVPLAHAVKAFRFVKLMRERGESWRRNGKTIRVGHFQVDRIDASGDFVAGCHNFTWAEVERVAKLAGVFECEASDSAVETSHA